MGQPVLHSGHLAPCQQHYTASYVQCECRIWPFAVVKDHFQLFYLYCVSSSYKLMLKYDYNTLLKAGIHPGWDTTPSLHTFTHTKGQFFQVTTPSTTASWPSG